MLSPGLGNCTRETNILNLAMVPSGIRTESSTCGLRFTVTLVSRMFRIWTEALTPCCCSFRLLMEFAKRPRSNGPKPNAVNAKAIRMNRDYKTFVTIDGVIDCSAET